MLAEYSAVRSVPYIHHGTCLTALAGLVLNLMLLLRFMQSSSRLSFRLFQLVLAVALWRHMLPGLAHKPTAYDPEFDDFDRQLLTSLGFQVLDQEPPHIVTARTLMYMPCCPRQLYSQVLVSSSLRYSARSQYVECGCQIRFPAAGCTWINEPRLGALVGTASQHLQLLS